MAVYVLHRTAPEVNAAMQKRHLRAVHKKRTMLFLLGFASIVACGMLYMAEPYFLFLYLLDALQSRCMVESVFLIQFGTSPILSQ